MKIQRPSYEIWLQKPGELGIYQQIERAGRVCYKSENNTTVNSAKPFVDRMVQSEHFAMLEHGTVYLVCKHGELPLYVANESIGEDYQFSYNKMIEYNKNHPDGYIMPYIIFTTDDTDNSTGGKLPWRKDTPVTAVNSLLCPTGALKESSLRLHGSLNEQ